MMIAGLLLLIAGVALPAEDAPATEKVANGTRHLASGVICPDGAGNLAFKDVEATGDRISCSYEYKCPQPGAGTCGTASAFATLAWRPGFDFASRFDQMVGQLQLEKADGGPAWGAKLNGFASGGEGEHRAHAGWWEIAAPGGRTINLGGVYNAGAAGDMEKLVVQTARVNAP